jgi:crossover junction endodeoxyribonuclease RusA
MTLTTTAIELFVPGKPIPQGSKRHVGRGIMVEAAADLAPWRERIALAAHSTRNQTERRIHPGAVTLRLTFVLPRPKSTPKHTPPAIKRPDIDKITRAVCDAITGILIADDAQIVDLHATKRIAETGETPGVWIRMEPA